MALKKICRCGRLIDHNKRYCSKCASIAKRERAARHKYYDTHQRDKRAAAFYNSPDWEKTREYVLAKYKGLDLYVFFIEKKIVPATTVHHIVELTEDWDLRLALSNLFPTSDSNHNVIHGLYEKDKKATQKVLIELLKRWEEEYGGKGQVSKVWL